MPCDFRRFRFAAPAFALFALLGGCSITPDDGPTVAYREAEVSTNTSLEVPPDLRRPRSDNALRVSAGDGSESGSGSGSYRRLLPEFDGVRFVRSGAASWLEVDDTAPDAIWPRIDSFLRSQGLNVIRREPELGIIETGWAERFDSPPRGGIGGWINSVFDSVTSSNIQDKYQIRLERMAGDDGVRVFVAHQAAEEVNVNQNTVDSANYAWSRKRNDPAIETEMARRLLVYMGLSERDSEAVVADAMDGLEAKARYIVDGDAARVMVADPNPRRVFARAGDALGSIGADIRSTDRERGVYVFEWTPPDNIGGGGLFGLFGGGESEPVLLELQLFDDRGGVRIKAADEKGQPRSGEVHRALLREVAIAMGASPEEVQRAEEQDEGGGSYQRRRGYDEPTR